MDDTSALLQDDVLDEAGVAGEAQGVEDPQEAESQAEREAREAAEAAEAYRQERIAAANEAFERMKARDAELVQERAAQARDAIASGAGFMTSAGVYYDAEQGAKALRAQAAARKKAAAEAALAARKAREEAGDENLNEDTFEIPADTDVDSEADIIEAEEQAGYVDEAEFGRRVAKLTEAITRRSTHRELLYRLLAYCRDEARDLRELERKVQTLSGFALAASNPYHFIEVLENAGGLERFELDEQGEVVTPERKKGLSEDEVDDLVASYSFMATPAGLAVIEQHTPKARIIELLNLVPERKDAYIELLGFCSEEPRTYAEISQLFEGRDVLVRMVDGEPQTMQPSVFVDKLEAAAGIEWRDGWVLTEEGRSFLEELKVL